MINNDFFVGKKTDLRRCTSSPCMKGCSCIEVPQNFSYDCFCGSEQKPHAEEASSPQPAPPPSQQSHQVYTKQPSRPKNFVSDSSTQVYKGNQKLKAMSSFASVPYYASSSSLSSSRSSTIYHATASSSRPLAQTQTNQSQNSQSSTADIASSSSTVSIGSVSSSQEMVTNMTKKATLYYDSISSTETMKSVQRASPGVKQGAAVSAAGAAFNFDGKRPCVDFNPCKHGQCVPNNQTGEFVCECSIGYMGPFCDLMRHPCDFKPCENGICEIVGDLYYKCLCKPNYTGVNCHIEIKPCDESTCLNGGRCRSLTTFDETDIGCDCPINFTGTICENGNFSTSLNNTFFFHVFLRVYN